MFYEVVPTKLFRQDGGILTYSSDTPLLPGQVVVVPLGRTSCPGIVIRQVASVNFKTKPITKILYNTPLPEHLIKAMFWLSDYYLTPLPTAANLLLPTGVTNARRKSRDDEKAFLRGVRSYGEHKRRTPATAGWPDATPQKGFSSSISLNPAQKTALRALKTPRSATKLLHGVTGSGKTNMYLEMASRALQAQNSVILLVPEIALTSQLVQIFERTFPGQVILVHSRQTESERHQLWEMILKEGETEKPFEGNPQSRRGLSDEARNDGPEERPEKGFSVSRPSIIIGPRSALLAPVHNLGLILVDEAHESAYFQESPPKYSAIRLASFIANTLHINCILGTATPLVTDYHLAKQRNALIPLTTKAKPTTPPNIQIIDLKSSEHFSRNRYFSNELLATITANLAHHHQTLVFHNRRGSAPLTLCDECGWQALCPTCFLPLTLHTDTYTLRCHTCGHEQPVPSSCPTCHHPSILHKGFGTKLLENELHKLFPTARIARFDTDNAKSETLDYLYNDVKNGDIDILIGTQTLAKGLDLPKLASVGIVQADAGLSLPDYSAEERTFHLLTQVIGRVGRGHLDNTSVIIQTYQPDSPIIQAAIHNDYEQFATYLLNKRRRQHLPPYTYLAKLTITYKTEQTTLSKIRTLARALHDLDSKLSVSTPMPAFHEHTTRGYTWQLIARSSSRQQLTKALRQLPPSLQAHLTLDPPSLL